MHTYTQITMARNLAVADDVYEMLSKEKRDGESFSEVIRRLASRRGSLLECAGILADLPEEKFRRFREAALGVDRPISKELGREK